MDIAMPVKAAEPARVLDMQRQADRRDGSPPVAQRLAALKSLDMVLRANKDAIADAVAADFGHRSHHETILA